jgi:ligand-binding SRPBCC domain-containing protein
MSFYYQAEQWLPYPSEAVFAFFANPENLPALIPPWQKARIEQSTLVPPPQASGSTSMAGAGSRITLSFRPLPAVPFRIRWQAEITEFDPHSHFTDRQVEGPFTFWTHTHRIRSVDRAGINITVIIDQVEYGVPMGPVGSIVNALFIRKQLERTFAFRQKRIAELIPKFLNPVIAMAQSQVVHPIAPGKLSA